MKTLFSALLSASLFWILMLYAMPAFALQEKGASYSKNIARSQDSLLDLDALEIRGPIPMMDPEEIEAGYDLIEDIVFQETTSKVLEAVKQPDAYSSIPREPLSFTKSRAISQASGRTDSSSDSEDAITVNPFKNSVSIAENQNEKEWTVVDKSSEEQQKKLLELFKDFTKKRNSFVLGFITDEEGKIVALRDEQNPETCVVGMAQQLLLNHEPIVAQYYSVLKKEYGQEIADQVFPLKKREEALREGLQNSMIFDTLTGAIGQSIRQLRSALKNNRTAGVIDHGASAIDPVTIQKEQGQLSQILQSFSIVPFWDWFINKTSSSSISSKLPLMIGNVSSEEKLDQFLEQLEVLLNDIPQASAVSETKSQSLLEYGTSLALKVTDFSMAAQSSVVWLRRAVWLAAFLKSL